MEENMKNMLKKVMVVVMAFTLLVGATAVPTQNAQAASEMKKADFKFTGKYKSNMNAAIKRTYGVAYDIGYSYVNTNNEKAPKKCIKTKRGITLNSTKEQVFKKYGEVTLEKLKKSSPIYKGLKKDDKNAFNLIKNEQFAVYSYQYGYTGCDLFFFFDKKGKVNTIVAGKNCY